MWLQDSESKAEQTIEPITVAAETGERFGRIDYKIFYIIYIYTVANVIEFNLMCICSVTSYLWVLYAKGNSSPTQIFN